MRLIFKLVVLGFIGLAVLPTLAPEQDHKASAEDGSQVPSPAGLVALIGQAASDLGNICRRQPEMCETGSEWISLAGSRAREGLEIAYDMFRHGHPSMQNQNKDASKPEAATE